MSSNGTNVKDGKGESHPTDNQFPSFRHLPGYDHLAIVFDESSDSYHVTIPTKGEVSIGLLIVQAVATITETDPLDLEPLGETLDVTSLENLFESLNNSRANTVTPATFTFEYTGCEVSVKSSTEVIISP